jgi:amino acid adenylation domain-containing protein
VAVVCGDEQLSYAELECRANQLAHHLRAAYGVGADTRVGICQQRSLQLVVSVLAVLKAGGAYVPLDVAYPSERLGYICADAELPVVLCDDAGVAALGAVAARLLHVADLAVSAQPVTAPECQSQCSDAAYVIYTSGSTGQPKGVVVEHRNVVSLVLPGDYAGLGRETVMLGNAPISFDAATFEWWGALLHGGRLVMHLEAADVVALMEGMRQAQVNTAWLTSGLFDVFVQQLTQPLPALRYLLVGGDVVNPQSVQQMQQRHPALQVINGYGPTENTTFSTTWALGPVTADAGLPIGKPLPNRRCYVLNSQLQRVPVGVVGELYVAGAGLARGYLNRPALTEERFIANPFGAGRLYRTGDLVRYRAEGALEYLGRNDFQLKIRGYRIEAGEIEAALQRCGAEVALVSAQRDSAGHQVLVGYYQAADLPVETLRQRLSQSLPAHLVPSWLVQVGQFKLSANGKIDRKALPAVDLSGQLAEYEAPATATEQQLAEIWQQLLGVPVVGRQDNFFTLGGHSLLATRLVALISQRFARQLPYRLLFETATIAAIAEYLTTAAGEMPSQVSCLVSLNHGKEQQPLFVVPGAGGHVFSLQQVAQHYGPNRMVYGLEATGLMTDAEPLDSVTAIASQNIAILKAVQPEGPYHLMGHSFGGVVAFEMACQLGQQVASLTLLDSMAPQLMADQPMADDESLLAQIVTVLLSNRGLSVAEPAIRLTDITETDQVNSTLQLLATHGVMLEPAWFRRFFQVYKAHLIAYRTYQATPFVGKAKLLLLKSEFADPTLPDYGWALWLPATLQISSVPGDHFEMLRDAGAVSICSQWQQLQQGSKDLVHQQRLLVAE